jgi:protein-S-isoprenylcysteine O-methyltransferase Ste14
MNSPETTVLHIIAPPPVLYIGTLLIGGALQAAFPFRLFSAFYAHVLFGVLLVTLSAVFARWSFLTMRRIGTTANPRKPSEALATDGPFRFSRNPIYVAMTGLYVGASILANAAWPLLLLAPLLLLVDWGVIRREERYLSEKFGDAYTDYMARVRRWL